MSITIEVSHRQIAGLTAAAALALTGAGAWAQQAPAFGFGTEPDPAELAQFVSPLPDGRGLPAGSGSATQGKAIYESSCLACHGDKLQGGLGDRLAGGRGTLVQSDAVKGPVKTVESYWPYATTLFDYVKRAMPLQAPGTMSNDDVYAVCAYILAETGIIAPNTILDDKSLPEVRMPNRDGFIADPRPEQFGGGPAVTRPHRSPPQ